MTDTDDKLDVLIQVVEDLVEKVETLTAQYDELLEKLANITTSGSGFRVDDFEEN